MNKNLYSNGVFPGHGEQVGVRELAALWQGKPLRPAPLPHYPTGIDTLDWALGGAKHHAGLHAGQVHVIAARTGHGKSALAEQIALHVSRSASVLYYGLELGRDRTQDRMLAKVMGSDVTSARNVLQNPAQAESWLTKLNKHHLRLAWRGDDDEAMTLDHVLDDMVNNHPNVVVIDHLRHLDDWLRVPPRGSGLRSGRELAAYTAMRLPKIARATKAAIVVVHQLKNELQEGRTGARPSQYDLADTSELAQNADHVWLIHRPFHKQGMRDNVAEIVVDKNREGPTCLLHAEWKGSLMRYRDMNPEEEQELECCKPRTTARTWQSGAR